MKILLIALLMFVACGPSLENIKIMNRDSKIYQANDGLYILVISKDGRMFLMNRAKLISNYMELEEIK